MITSRGFGSLSDGTEVTCYRLHGSGGAYVDVLDYGAAISSLVVPDRDGWPVDVVLGYDTARDYEAGQLYFGATVGRHANRIGGGTFTLGGVRYDLERNCGPNHSHGGSGGFHRRMFSAEVWGDRLRLFLLSPDGDQGYPGTLRLGVIFSFSPEHTLTIRHNALSDRDTVVNLTSHSYFDLSGGIAPMGQLLRLDADSYTENDADTLPTGRIFPLGGTPFDFRREKPIGRDVGCPELGPWRGYDHNYVLKNGGALEEFARLTSPETGISMAVETDLPGVQLYSGGYVEGRGRGGRIYHSHDGVCLEPQFFPNAMAIRTFRKPILPAWKVYQHTIVYRFG